MKLLRGTQRADRDDEAAQSKSPVAVPVARAKAGRRPEPPASVPASLRREWRALAAAVARAGRFDSSAAIAIGILAALEREMAAQLSKGKMPRPSLLAEMGKLRRTLGLGHHDQQREPAPLAKPPRYSPNNKFLPNRRDLLERQLMHGAVTSTTRAEILEDLAEVNLAISMSDRIR